MYEIVHTYPKFSTVCTTGGVNIHHSPARLSRSVASMFGHSLSHLVATVTYSDQACHVRSVNIVPLHTSWRSQRFALLFA